jgi:DNA uptake protein ComE-like DNA-binding protein
VASLARLPGIGLTRARAIITLRNRLQNEEGRIPAFRNADDLAQVKGIGPATVDGMRPWLRFDASPGDANTPADW